MPKFLEDEMRLQYKKNFKELLAQVNPKPGPEVLEKLLNRYVEERKERGTK